MPVEEPPTKEPFFVPISAKIGFAVFYSRLISIRVADGFPPAWVELR